MSIVPREQAGMRFALVLAFFWGVFWAMFLQFTQLGRFLALRRTWITVVIGVGVDLIIALHPIPYHYVLRFFSIIAASSLGIISRSLINELSEITEEIDVIKVPFTQ